MSRSVLIGALVALGVFVLSIGAGSLIASGPSAEVAEGGRRPTTTTTTEPPPEGVVVVRLDNGSFRPSNLKIDLDEVQIVEWVNEDPREYVIVGSKGEFESPVLGQGDRFRFDFSTLPPGIYRYSGLIGRQQIPGTVDTRPQQ